MPIVSLHPGKPNTPLLTAIWILSSKKADGENICPPQRCTALQDSNLATFKIIADRASKFSNLSYLAHHLGHLHQRWWAWIPQASEERPDQPGKLQPLKQTGSELFTSNVRLIALTLLVALPSGQVKPNFYWNKSIWGCSPWRFTYQITTWYLISVLVKLHQNTVWNAGNYEQPST